MSQHAPRGVLVTGASRGIGAAVAHAFASRGDRVAVHYGTGAARARQVVAALPGVGHLAVGADLHEPAAIETMVDAAADGLGSLSVLVNNAGIFTPHHIHDVDYATWQAAWNQTLGVNLVGAANVSFCAARHIRAAGGGAIVNVASRGAFRGEPKQPAYGASKAGLIALGQSLARALGPDGISVTSVAPTFALTDMAAANLAGAEGDRRRAESPLNRIVTPEEVAAAVVYLASPEAAMASGSVLDLNGASHLRL